MSMEWLLKRTRKRSTMFTKLIVSYIMVLLIPLVIGSYFYKEVVRIIENDAQAANVNTLLQTRDIVDVRLKEIQSISKQIALHSSVNNLLNHPPFNQGDKEYIKVYETHNELPKFALTNQFISDYYIVFKKSGIVLTSEGVYASLDELQRNEFPHLTSESFQQIMWSETMADSFYNTSDSRINDAGNRLLYLQGLPIGAAKQRIGTVAIEVDTRIIQGLLKRTDIGRHGMAYIMDNQGNIVTSIQGDLADPSLIEAIGSQAEEPLPAAIDDSYIISQTFSEQAQWTYVSVVSTESVLYKVNYIKKVTVIILIAIMMAGLVASLFFSYRNTRPLLNMIRTIKKMFHNEFARAERGNEYDSLTQTMERIANDRGRMVQELENYRPVMISTLYRRLLEGDFANDEEVYQSLDHMGISIERDGVLVMIVSVEKLNHLVYQDILKETDSIKILVKEMYQQSMSEAIMHIYDFDHDKLVFIFTGSKTGMPDFHGALQETANLLRARSGDKLNIFFSVGSAYPGIRQAHESFMEAKSAIEFASYSGKGWVEYRDLPEQDEVYVFPIETEVRLVRMIKAGDFAGVREITEHLKRENLINRKLTTARIEQLIQVIKGSLQRGLGHIQNESLKQTLTEMNAVHDFEGVIHGIHASSAIVHHVLEEQKKKAKQEVGAKILQYLNNHFMDESLTIGQAANHFGMSESSFYSFFKENTGTTFSSRLEQLRMEKACEMLKDGNDDKKEIGVKDIAVKVGYGNEHTFRRAFKRVIGMVPSEYMRIARSGDNTIE